MQTRQSVFLMPAGALLFAACGGHTPAVAPATPVQAEVITVQNQPIPVLLQAPGTVQARDRVVLSSQVNGFVRGVSVRAGDSVAAGQVLVTLDSRDAEGQKEGAQAGLEEAKAALAEARSGAQMALNMRAAAKASADLANGTYARYQKLAESRSVSPQELDEMRARRDAAAADFAAKEAMVAAAEERLRQVEARIAQAGAQMRRADVYLGWSVVKAPAAGRVVERSVDPGSAIFPGTPLITLESTSRPQVLANLPTGDAGSLRNGLEVRVRIPDQPQAAVTGRISEVVPLSAPGSHTVQFKVDLPAGVAAVSGTFVSVEISMGTRTALLVPVQAVRESGQLAGVFVVDAAGKAGFRLIKATPFDSDRMEVLAGVREGERIIAKLTDQIIDGVSLEIRR
jgi:multidrug efflux pump subunit AcrA (membrane-fusion protein)